MLILAFNRALYFSLKTSFSEVFLIIFKNEQIFDLPVFESLTEIYISIKSRGHQKLFFFKILSNFWLF